ncbi:hypothetical protein O1611_g2674 [Lasiodiplodia mahajangana]|uniref:Uncharacterized protein n=1 Tax=Lasiodiplodia mahajangana TaxID=1108764 RepID=A0ACC2JTV7_9PEZI|nr:hypothetical protein O1611_g2674 [Lasiodiplodia mahajangana]
MNEAGIDYDVSLDEPLDLDIPDFSTGNTIVLPAESAPADQEVVSGEASGEQSQRRYLSKRPHRKSRAGCKQCKKRKCDEAKPACKACILRKEECVYSNVPPPVLPSTAAVNVSATATAPTVPLVVRSREQSVEACWELDDDNLHNDLIPVISEPLFIPEQVTDVIDMKMLWFYSTYSFQSFSINAGRSPMIDYALKVKVVQHAFRSPFLMETLKALSALHLRTLNQPVPNHKAVEYQARAFQGYRNAIETANPKDFPALLGCSLFTIAMSSQTFRDPNGKRLFIVDWIAMWRGIGLIIELISPQAVQDSGLANIFYRPPIDMEKSVQYIPNNLLFMVTSIKYGDPDYEYQKEYYELLKYLGSLYMELVEHGFGPVLDLRTITFFSFCPRPLLPLAKQFRPRVLIVIAYWLCFVKLSHPGPWWMLGITPQADQIFEEVGVEWEHLLRVPRMVMQTDNDVQIARLIIDNHNWTPSELDLYRKHRDPRAKTDLKLISNLGAELEIAEGEWRFKADGTRIRWGESHLPVPDVEPDPSSQKLLIGNTLLYKAAPLPTTSAQSPATSSPASSAPGLSPSNSSPSKSPSP